MEGPVENFLLQWRIGQVLPHLRGEVLDVRCGVNALLKSYRDVQPYCRGVGIDVHPWAGVDMVIEDSGDLPFETDSFDTVCCIAALNRIPNRGAFLKEVRRVLRPDGRFIITMIPPGFSRFWHMLRSPFRIDPRKQSMRKASIHGLDRMQIGRLLLAAGFSRLETSSFMLGTNTMYIAE